MQRVNRNTAKKLYFLDQEVFVLSWIVFNEIWLLLTDPKKLYNLLSNRNELLEDKHMQFLDFPFPIL